MSQYITIPVPSSARADDLGAAEPSFELLDTRDEGLDGTFELFGICDEDRSE